MGYDIYCDGGVEISPPLNDEETAYMRDFLEARHMTRVSGPYYAKGGDRPHGPDPDVINRNVPGEEQLSLYSPLEVTDDGTTLCGPEDYVRHEGDHGDWLAWLIEHLLGPAGRKKAGKATDVDDRLDAFTFDHVLNGELWLEGEDGKRWMVEVKDNVVTHREGVVVYCESPVGPTAEPEIVSEILKAIATDPPCFAAIDVLTRSGGSSGPSSILKEATETVIAAVTAARESERSAVS